MRDASLRDLLKIEDGSTHAVPTGEREAWARVREAVADVCALPPAQREAEVARLRASDDAFDRRVAELVNLEGEAAGFLEHPVTLASDDSVPPLIYRAGDVVGPYRVVSLLGRGGMGQVYLASDTRLLRDVALKVLTAPRYDASLLREAQLAARLNHRNIAVVHDVLEANGRLHIVMERLIGQTVAARLQAGPVRLEDGVEWLLQIVAAISHAHAEHVVHCDLKPANVFILPTGDVKVLDFGLARPSDLPRDSASLLVGGTPRYLAPERLLGEHPSPRTDIYSAGVLFRDVLAKVDAEGKRTARYQAVQQVADKASEAAPLKRYATAEEMAAAVTEALSVRPLRAASPGRQTMMGVAAGVLAAGLGLGLYLTVPTGDSAPPAVTVRMSAIGGDPLAGHVAAALEQLVMRSLRTADGLVVVPPGEAPSTAKEAGATHVLAGTVERSGDQLRLAVSLNTSDDVWIASKTTSVAVSQPQTVVASALDLTAALLLEKLDVEAPPSATDTDDVERSLSVNPQAFEEYAQAREYMRTPEVKGRADYAIDLLQRATRRDPEFALAHASLAELYWQKYESTREPGWTDRAWSSALNAVRLNPADPAVRYTLALIYRGKGENEIALSEATRAIGLQPANDDLYRLRARIFDEMGLVDRALADLANARRLRPGYWENHRTTGVVLVGRSRYEEAVPHFQRAAELRPTSATVHQALGTALHAAGRHTEALDAYNKSLAIAPTPSAYSNVGKLHYDDERFPQALAAYERSVSLRPKDPITHRNLGDTLARMGLTARSQEAYRTAIKLSEDNLRINPHNIDAVSLQALCYAKLGDRARARTLADQTLTTGSITANFRYRAGVALILAGDHAPGVEAVLKALTDGFSRTEAAADYDLRSVLSDTRLRAALGLGPVASRDPP